MDDGARIEELIDEMVGVHPEIFSEPQAFKRVVLRMGIDRGIIEAVRVLSKSPTPNVEANEVKRLRELLREAVGWNWLDDEAEHQIPRYDEIIDAIPHKRRNR
jgi:hypothetical protein